MRVSVCGFRTWHFISHNLRQLKQKANSWRNAGRRINHAFNPMPHTSSNISLPSVDKRIKSHRVWICLVEIYSREFVVWIIPRALVLLLCREKNKWYKEEVEITLSQTRPCGIYGGKNEVWQIFLRVLRISPVNIIPLMLSHILIRQCLFATLWSIELPNASFQDIFRNVMIRIWWKSPTFLLILSQKTVF